MPTSAGSFSTGLVLVATGFSLGVVYSNWPYDFNTLWTSGPSQEAFELSLIHYRTWMLMPTFLKHVHHFFMVLGFIGLFIKLYRPSESNKLFDGGSLVLYVVAISFYIINLKTGAESCVSGIWGDVDQNTGINVIAATQVFIVFALLGILAMQIGQFWAELEDARLAKMELAKEERAKKAEKEAEESKKDEDQPSSGQTRKRESKKHK